MKIAMAMEMQNIQSKIGQSFGRGSFFLIYDTDENSEKFIGNTAQNASGGAGIKAAETLAAEKVNIVVVLRLGQNASDVLNAAGIKVLKGQDVSAEENIKLAKNGMLSALNNTHPGFHGKQQ